MAKVTIVFEDKDGETSISGDFDPPIERGKVPTSAQRYGWEILSAFGSAAGGGVGAALDAFVDDEE
jgi:hypothetical protein